MTNDTLITPCRTSPLRMAMTPSPYMSPGVSPGPPTLVNPLTDIIIGFIQSVNAVISYMTYCHDVVC